MFPLRLLTPLFVVVVVAAVVVLCIGEKKKTKTKQSLNGQLQSAFFFSPRFGISELVSHRSQCSDSRKINAFGRREGISLR